MATQASESDDQWEGEEEDRYYHDPTYGYDYGDYSGGTQQPYNFLPPYSLCESASTIYAPHPYPGPGASGFGGSSYQIEVSGWYK